MSDSLTELVEREISTKVKEIEDRINALMAATAKKIRKALAEDNRAEIERILTHLEKGLGPD